MDDLEYKIRISISKLFSLGELIKLSSLELEKNLNSEEARREFENLADAYKNLTNDLKILLEAYFAEEKKKGDAINLTFKRLYQKILDNSMD